jgi:hypothetical protein
MAVALSFFMLFSGCRRSSDEIPVMPPETNPLAREYIGYGVVTVSFTHVLTEPDPKGVSQGYLRRGTVVPIVERRQLNNQGKPELWVLTEGNYRGWLQVTALEIYENESRANTASKNMKQ